MKVEYINPFIEAAKGVFKSLLDVDAELGEIYLKSSPFSVSNLIIMIGVVGEIRGQVCLEMPFATAQKIASTMIDGTTVIEIDEIASSAIAELGNMIMGTASTIFSGNNVHIDITPPTILIGEKIKISNKIATIGIPLTLNNYGSFDINVTAE